MQRHFSIWKTTILGGVIFLLPFAIIVFLLGQIVQVIYSVAGQINSFVPQWSFGGVSLAVLLAALVLIVLCYAAGLAARRSLGRQFSAKVERNVLLFFPRYAIWKSQLASNFGADEGETALQPVLVEFDDAARIGFEIERANCPPPASAAASDAATSQAPGNADADAGETVTVYLPGSPDPWNGHVVHVSSRRVRPLAAKFGDATAVCESMGRGAGKML